jgi:rhamnogalacturonyl hydrolase YesR
MSTAREQLQALDAWVSTRDFAGWDPYDALNSPLLKGLSLGTRYGGILWVQLLKRSPWNLRPLLGVPAGRNPKGIGLFLHGAALEFEATGEARIAARITDLGGWLLDRGNRDHGGLGWGYNFPWPGRSFYCPAGTPTVVGTAYIGQALLQAWRVTQDPRWLRGAREAAVFVHEGLPESARNEHGHCAAYTPLDRARIPNANLLGAALLLAVGTAVHDPGLIRAGSERMDYSVAGQAADGSWPYGEAANQAWIDSFHTGYNLMAIEQGWRLTGEPRWRHSLERGLAFYLDHFFEPDGTVKYFHHRRGPLDPHAFAHALITLQALSGLDARCTALHARVLQRLEALFRLPDGSYSFWITESGRRVDIPYMRWVQAWVHLALAYAVHGRGPFTAGEVPA